MLICYPTYSRVKRTWCSGPQGRPPGGTLWKGGPRPKLNVLNDGSVLTAKAPAMRSIRNAQQKLKCFAGKTSARRASRPHPSTRLVQISWPPSLYRHPSTQTPFSQIHFPQGNTELDQHFEMVDMPLNVDISYTSSVRRASLSRVPKHDSQRVKYC